MIKEKCKHCGKIIEGYTDNQVEHMMNQHKLAKHKEKIKVE